MAYNTSAHRAVRASIAVGLSILLSVSLFSSVATAQTAPATSGNQGKSYTLLEPLPCIEYSVDILDSQGNKTTKKMPPGGCSTNATTGVQLLPSVSMGDFFQYAFNLLIALSGAAAVFMIVWGGFKYVTTDSWQGKKEGLDKFKNAIIGLLMVLGAYLILKTINPVLVSLPESIPALAPPASLSGGSSVYDLLSQQASQYQIADTAQLKSDIAVAKAKEQDLLKQKADLEDQLLAAQESDDPSQTDLESEIADIDSQIGDLEADAILNTALIGFQDTLTRAAQAAQSAGNSINSAGIIDVYINTINRQYSTAESGLQNHYDHLEILHDAAMFCYGVLTIEKDGISENVTTTGTTVAGLWGGTKGALLGIIVKVHNGMYHQISNTVDTVANGLVGSITKPAIKGFDVASANVKQKKIADKIYHDVVVLIADQIYDDDLRNDLIAYAQQFIDAVK